MLMLRPRTLVALAPFVLALAAHAPLVAQDRVIPKADRGIWGGGTYTLESTVPASYYQLWMRGDNLPTGFMITGLSLVAHPTLAASAGTADLTIRITNTALDFHGIGTSLAANLGNRATTVFPTAPIRSAGTPPGTTPNTPMAFFPFAAPFVVAGPHMLVEIDETNRSYGSGVSYDGTIANPPPVQIAPVGPSCGIGLGAGYNATGGSVVLSAGLVPPNSAVHFLLGVENYQAGGVQYPVDLGFLGMTGCRLGFEPMVIASVPAPTGLAQLTIPFTPPSDTAVVFAQAVHASTANPMGLATTNTQRLILGNTGLIRDVWSADGITAYTGWPRAWDSAVMLLLR